MSMIGNWLQLSPSELSELVAEPSRVESFIYPDDEERADCMDVDKAWQAIHFILNGDPWEGSPPLGNVVLGGTEIGDDVGYGPASFLTAEEVRAAARALDAIPPHNFESRYDAAALHANEVYPDIWDESAETVEYLVFWYTALRKYFVAAAAKGNAMLKFIN